MATRWQLSSFAKPREGASISAPTPVPGGAAPRQISQGRERAAASALILAKVASPQLASRVWGASQSPPGGNTARVPQSRRAGSRFRSYAPMGPSVAARRGIKTRAGSVPRFAALPCPPFFDPQERPLSWENVPRCAPPAPCPSGTTTRRARWARSVEPSSDAVSWRPQGLVGAACRVAVCRDDEEGYDDVVVEGGRNLRRARRCPVRCPPPSHLSFGRGGRRSRQGLLGRSVEYGVCRDRTRTYHQRGA